ncbi:MAG: flagellar assembly protein FliW [Planctomycetota bacterium]|nr:flagellar assembly protein FliW [Planctomycetota bacterium]
MKVATPRFGEIEVKDDAVYCFPEGILGFAPVKLYFILDNPKGGPFQWLQAVEPPELAFVVCDPRLFLPNYAVAVRKEDLANIELENIEDGFVLVVLTVPSKNPRDITANLMGPLIFNPKKRLAKQLVLADPAYTTKHRVFGEEGGGEKKASEERKAQSGS